VFGRDLMNIHIDEVPEIPVVATVVSGRVVYAGA